MEKQISNPPRWATLLVEAVNKPGMIMKAYSAFHNYSIGNQILAIVQCQLRGLEPAPINTFPGWHALGRNVKRGERGLTLCMREALGPEGADFCRGYIQNWLYKSIGYTPEAILEKSTQRIFRATDQILKGGRAEN